MSFEQVSTYVHDRLQATGQMKSGFFASVPQMQESTALGQLKGDATVLTVGPEDAESVCRRVVEEIDLLVRSNGIKSIGVLDLFMPLGVDKVQVHRTLLPSWLAAQVGQQLRTLAGKDYEVVHERKMHSAARPIHIDEVRQENMLRLLQRRSGASAVVFGLLREAEETCALEYELVNPENGESLGEAVGVFRLSPAHLGNLGRNGNFIDVLTADCAPNDSQRIQAVRSRTDEGHPLLGSEFPFPIEVFVNGQKRELMFSFRQGPAPDEVRAECRLEVQPSDRLKVAVTNRFVEEGKPARVGMRLLLNGISSLGGKRDVLDRGPLLVLDAESRTEIDGTFVLKPQRNGHDAGDSWRPLMVTDVGQPQREEGRLGDVPGVLSFGFFDDHSDARCAWPMEAVQLKDGRPKRLTFSPGRCLAVVHVRCVPKSDRAP